MILLAIGSFKPPGGRKSHKWEPMQSAAPKPAWRRAGHNHRVAISTAACSHGAWALLAARLALGDRGLVTLVHAHCGEDIAVLPLARLAALRHACPLVVTVHTSVRHTLRVTSARTAMLRLAGGLAEGRVLPRADMVIGLTRSAADRLLREGLPENRVRVIPPGYDPDLFTAVTSDPFPRLPRPRIAYVGRIARQKDVGTLVQAFGQVREQACLLIVDDGPERQAAQRQARPLAGQVHFAGFLPHPRSRQCCGQRSAGAGHPVRGAAIGAGGGHGSRPAGGGQPGRRDTRPGGP